MNGIEDLEKQEREGLRIEGEMLERIRRLMVDDGLTRPVAVQKVVREYWRKLVRRPWFIESCVEDYLSYRSHVAQAPPRATVLPARIGKTPRVDDHELERQIDENTSKMWAAAMAAVNKHTEGVIRDVLAWAISHPKGGIALANATVEDVDEAIAALEKQVVGTERLIVEHRRYRDVLASHGVTRGSGRTGKDAIDALVSAYMEEHSLGKPQTANVA